MTFIDKNSKYRKWLEGTCEYCGQTFMHRSDHNAKYCSRKCAGASKKKSRNKICPQCGNEFYASNIRTQFCSPECLSISKKKEIKSNCLTCNKEITGRPSDNRKFCSKECLREYYSIHNTREGSPMWTGGTIDQNGYTFIKQNDGSYKQEHRIVMEEHLGRPLSSNEIVHHINGNKKDNSIENLCVLTRSQHMEEHRDGLYLTRKKTKAG